MKTKLLTTAALLLSIVGASNAAYAETDAERLEKLEKEIRLLKRQQEVGAEVAQGRASKSANVEIGSKGLSISSPDKEFSLKLRGYAQIDSRNFLDDDASTGKDDILARRVRPTLEGTAFGDYSYRIMADFAGSSTRIFDAHVDYKYADPLQFRIGKFKPPVGLERLQSATDTFFIERGHPTNLAPSRDLGAQIYGNLLDDSLEYQLGIFNGNADLANTDSDDDDKKDFAARVFATPFKSSEFVALQGLGFGIAGSVGDREGSPTKPILGDYRTPGQQSFFKYLSGTAAADNVYASGRHERIYPQAYWYYSNFGLLTEYAISKQDIKKGNNSASLDNKAWQVAASYVLTGEDVNFKGGVKPYNAFNLEKGGWGAFEVVARTGATEIDDSAFPIFADINKSAKEAKSLGGGINWYLNENVKLAIDYDQTKFDRGASAGKDRPDERALFTRVQYRF